MLRHSLLAAVAAVMLAGASQAQAPTLVRVHGVVYDSLRSQPLGGAIVSFTGDSRIARADSRGRFSFDSVAPGQRTFAAQHAVLDSMGFSGISARVTISDGQAPIVVASPSFGTLWRSMCGTTRPPKDSGFVYGTVTNAVSGKAAPNAVVEVTWVDLRVDKAKRLSEQRWSGRSPTDATGNYGICGIPLDVGLRIRAAGDSTSSGSISLIGTGARVQRRDLLIGPVEFDTVVTAPRGTIAGIVMDTSGKAIADARIIADGAPELRSGPDGKFTVRGVPIGSRQVEVLAIGMSPVLTVADVTPTDTAFVLASMRRITTLDVVRVTASPMTRRLVMDLESRRKTSAGYFRDSTDVRNHGSLFSVFFEFPGVRVRRTGNGSDFMLMLGTPSRECAANVIIDGRRSDFDELNYLRPSDIGAMEVYPRRMSLPMQFIRDDQCGAVIIWTKWSLGG